MFYTIFLILHNLTRWAVLILGIYVLYRAFSGLFGGRAWADADARAVRWFAVAMTVQFVFGVLFYVLPGSLANQAIFNFAEIMREAQQRFFVMEHTVVMFVVLSLAHMAGGIIRRAADNAGKFRRAAIIYSIALVLILVAIPWPFFSYGRPLFRIG